MNPKPEMIIQFLQDEGLGSSIKTRNLNKENWKINFNEPWSDDQEQRCGILQVRDTKTHSLKIIFNCFKAVAVYGDIYKGSFWKFVKLVKGFETTTHAQNWFIEKYLLNSNLNEMIPNVQDLGISIDPNAKNLYFPEYFERFLLDKIHEPYYTYLMQRCVSKEQIEILKLFVNPKEKRIVFPVYENGDLLFYTGRSIIKDDPIPWKKAYGQDLYPVWNLENVHDVANIFEAIFDAIVIPGGIAILGSETYISEPLIKKIISKKFMRINIFFDNDGAGQRAKIKLAIELSRYHNNVWIYNFKGIQQKDFNSMRQNFIDFELEKRLMRWSLKTETMYRLKEIT